VHLYTGTTVVPGIFNISKGMTSISRPISINRMALRNSSRLKDVFDFLLTDIHAHPVEQYLTERKGKRDEHYADCRRHMQKTIIDIVEYRGQHHKY
jgi:hypothetical protein